ncbi:MAG: signal peptidase I [Lachnospiraceae bacterium]|nr:signal peptidase I [Lachnospiraceae bacterium]
MTSRRRRRRRSASFQAERKLTPQLIKEIATWILLTVAAVLAAVTVAMAFFKTVEMSGDSMEPAIVSGQRVFVNRLVYQMSQPERDDVIVFYGGAGRTRTYVKRVVAVGGDTVLITDGVLYVNGEAQDDKVFDRMRDAGIAAQEITLGSGEYFVLGDNRNNSEDSRSANIGLVRREQVLGRVWRVD